MSQYSPQRYLASSRWRCRNSCQCYCCRCRHYFPPPGEVAEPPLAPASLLPAPLPLELLLSPVWLLHPPSVNASSNAAKAVVPVLNICRMSILLLCGVFSIRTATRRTYRLKPCSSVGLLLLMNFTLKRSMST